LDLGPGRARSGDLHALNQMASSLRSMAAPVRETRTKSHLRTFESEGLVVLAAFRRASIRVKGWFIEGQGGRFQEQMKY